MSQSLTHLSITRTSITRKRAQPPLNIERLLVLGNGLRRIKEWCIDGYDIYLPDDGNNTNINNLAQLLRTPSLQKFTLSQMNDAMADTLDHAAHAAHAATRNQLQLDTCIGFRATTDRQHNIADFIDASSSFANVPRLTFRNADWRLRTDTFVDEDVTPVNWASGLWIDSGGIDANKTHPAELILDSCTIYASCRLLHLIDVMSAAGSGTTIQLTNLDVYVDHIELDAFGDNPEEGWATLERILRRCYKK